MTGASVKGRGSSMKLFSAMVAIVRSPSSSFEPEMKSFRKPVRQAKMLVDGFLWIDAEDFADYGDWRLDTADETLTRDGRQIELSPGQFKVLRLLLQRPSCVLTREEIQDAAWGYSHFLTRRDVNRTVAALRDKIESDPEDPEFIHTVEEIGYKFEMPESNGNDPDS